MTTPAPPRLNDSLTSMAAGTTQQICGKLLVTFITVYSYALVFRYWRYSDESVLVTSSALWAHIVVALLVDHQYYWLHRATHEINLGWGAHITHHSSEAYNLTTALRQGATQGLFGFAVCSLATCGHAVEHTARANLHPKHGRAVH